MIVIKPRLVWIALALGYALLAALSLILTAWLDLRPCHLCIFQRLLFMVLPLLAAAAALAPAASLVRRLAGLLVGLGAAWGLGVASYQSWLQAQPLGTLSCVGGQPGLIEGLVDWLGAQVPSLFLVTGYCEDLALVILGLSLANWALVAFAAGLVATAWALWYDRRP